MAKLFTRRKLDNMRISPDFRPEVIAKIKSQRFGQEAEYHSILMSLVRLGVNFTSVQKIDSHFESMLTPAQLDDLKQFSLSVKNVMRMSPNVSASALLRSRSKNSYCTKASDISSGFDLNRQTTLQAASIIEDFLLDPTQPIFKNSSFR